MNLSPDFKDKIFTADNNNFEDLALELFHYQAFHIPVYRDYLRYLSIPLTQITKLEQIKYLPISFFKSHKITTFPETDFYFQSSGTTQSERSKHYIRDLDFYKKNARLIFEKFYGSLKDFIVLALLPSYQENTFSSLIFMVNDFMEHSQSNLSRYLAITDHNIIKENIDQALLQNKKVILIGVTYALLELAEQINGQFGNLVIIETGGMKGRREELTRSEVHRILKNKFGVDHIHSEYGMTELRSQAYAVKDGLFSVPPWMAIKIRQLNDPFSPAIQGATGGINIIDLANVESIAFIETQDLGRVNSDNKFEVLGRIDYSEIRGCNLLAF